MIQMTDKDDNRLLVLAREIFQLVRDQNRTDVIKACTLVSVFHVMEVGGDVSLLKDLVDMFASVPIPNMRQPS